MELTQRKAIGNDRIASGIEVGNDVGSIQKFPVPETTNRAMITVGTKNTLPEGLLMHPLKRNSCEVTAPDLLRRVG